MAKTKTVFQCQSCGYTSLKWLGRCPDCGAWNSFSEERAVETIKGRERAVPLSFEEINPTSGIRQSTEIKEFDRVLGGGVVPGSVILIGGDPGIGKSTILLQAVEGLSRAVGKALYVSAEESPEQLKMRAERLSVTSRDIIILPETSLEGILKSVAELKPKVLVIDSIQTIYTEELPSAPGSVGQVRDCSTKLMFLAKKTGCPVFIIGHVTKEGAIAGPRILEHIVDTVLYFEGEKGQPLRILRAVKNRFGSTNEIGVFEMQDNGLKGVENPSELFLSERPEKIPGSAVISTIEGTRPLMVEIQALVVPTSFGMPRRTALGVDYNRVNLLIAVLEKRLGLHLGNMDVFINVVGGIKIDEPATDLAIAATIASSLKNIPVDHRTFVFGEIGLSGELRAIAQADIRVKEASNLGFKRGIIPIGNLQRMKEDHRVEVELIGAKDVEEALDILLF